MKESSIERRLKIEIEKNGGWCLKFVSPGIAGVPDRICLLPGGKIIFVELKAPGKKLRPLQIRICEKIKKLGFRVEIIDSIEEVKELIRNAI